MTKPQMERGFVSLVGAGPGDPDLLTRKAADRITDADLVLYDALVDPATLALAPTAQRVYVGKRAGRPQVRQEFIHWLMIRAARAGKKVVRLKGGDPFVFGRGGEEGLALAAAGISFEVVPGVSSAIAAAALAGIPVTHRGLSSGFVVVSGHAEDAFRPVLESLAPHSATVVVMMGLGRIDRIAALLIERGWNVTTPVAVISGASTSASSVWTTSLRDLQQQRLRPERGWAAFAKATASSAEAPRRRGPASIEKRRQDADDRAPATVVIGDVVRLGAVLGLRLDQPDLERGREVDAQAEADEAAAGGQ
jgi:uroporphyrin-III C-methyltransferase/precorrin-2 dehydrogenase/sirohydrochlorin ferrochelatase